jgi:hypothetical protein
MRTSKASRKKKSFVLLHVAEITRDNKHQMAASNQFARWQELVDQINKLEESASSGTSGTAALDYQNRRAAEDALAQSFHAEFGVPRSQVGYWCLRAKIVGKDELICAFASQSIARQAKYAMLGCETRALFEFCGVAHVPVICETPRRPDISLEMLLEVQSPNNDAIMLERIQCQANAHQYAIQNGHAFSLSAEAHGMVATMCFESRYHAEKAAAEVNIAIAKIRLNATPVTVTRATDSARSLSASIGAMFFKPHTARYRLNDIKDGLRKHARALARAKAAPHAPDKRDANDMDIIAETQ